jgi:hypothetical protein
MRLFRGRCRRAAPLELTNLPAADSCATSSSRSLDGEELAKLPAARALGASSDAPSVEPSDVGAAPATNPWTRDRAQRVVHVMAYIVGWYVISITLTLYNKWLFALVPRPLERQAAKRLASLNRRSDRWAGSTECASRC